MSLSTEETAPILARWNQPTVSVWAGPYLTFAQLETIKKEPMFFERRCREWGLGVETFVTLPRSPMMGDSELVVIFPLASQVFQTREVEFTAKGLQFVALPEADDDSRAAARQILGVGPEDDVSEWAALYKKISEMNSLVGSDPNSVAKELLQRLALVFNVMPKEIPIGFIQELKERQYYESMELAVRQPRTWGTL